MNFNSVRSALGCAKASLLAHPSLSMNRVEDKLFRAETASADFFQILICFRKFDGREPDIQGFFISPLYNRSRIPYDIHRLPEQASHLHFTPICSTIDKSAS